MSAEMQLLSIIGVTLFTVIIAVFLKQSSPTGSLLLCLGAGAVILFAVLKIASPVIDAVRSFADEAGIEDFDVLVKSVGIAAVSQLSAESCRDAGHSAAAIKIEYAGRAAIVIAALPLFEKALTLAREMIMR